MPKRRPEASLPFRFSYRIYIYSSLQLSLSAIEVLKSKHWFDCRPRHRIEHYTLVNPDLLRRIKALGCIATPFRTYAYYHGEKMPFYGDHRLEWMFARRSLLDHGIIATGATDYPPGPFKPLLGIHSCVTRVDSDGRLWGASQNISIEEAFKIYTI